MRKTLHIFLLFTMISLSGYCQQADPYLRNFTATQVEETVFLRWTMRAGSTCEDTHVERSTDGISYERIGLIGGICGSPDEEMTFQFTDTLPVANRLSYYRLLLGYFGYTTAEIVEFASYNDGGYFLGPNPFNDFTRIAFENKDKDEFRMVITDLQGRKVMDLNTTGNEFIIRREDLNAGIYIINFGNGENQFFSDRIIVN